MSGACGTNDNFVSKICSDDEDDHRDDINTRDVKQISHPGSNRYQEC